MEGARLCRCVLDHQGHEFAALDGEPDPWFDFKEASVDTRQFIPIAVV